MADAALGIAIGELRPTQMTVGYREVATKRREWHEAGGKDRIKLLRGHIVPAVIGPKRRHYIVDHHHFARALLEERASHVGVYVLADLSNLGEDEFWTFLDNSDWCHAYDDKGQRRALSAIPKGLEMLADDPYRSLASQLIRSCGCAKSNKPFSEFLWADFLRRRVKLSLVTDHFDEAVDDAMKLARGKEANSLPGWCPAKETRKM